MANYNTDLSFGNKHWLGSKVTPRTGVVERVATNGTVRVRSLQSGVKYDYTVVHGSLSKANVDAFKTFYATNRLLSFFFTALEDNVQRTVMFAANPYEVTPKDDNVNWELRVNLREI